MLSVALSVLGFLLILGPLVVFHEFGHYIFARIFNVKAEIFSIGFGPRLFSRQCGETEVRVSAIPLGGYVKLLGEERDQQLSAADQARALQSQAAWKRFFIFFGGPLFNFIMAVFLFMAILAIGEPQLAAVAGRVVEGSPAAKAGLESGDKILSVNGKPVRRYEELLSIVSEHPEKPVDLEVVHPGAAQPTHVSVVTTSESGFSVYGEQTFVGEIDGMFPTGRATTIGISDPKSPAGQAGMRTGDSIVEVNGNPVKSWEELERLYMRLPAAAPLRIKLKKAGNSVQDIALTKPAESKSLGTDLGLHSSELFIEKAVPKSPAANAGIQAGDRLVGVGKRDVNSFFELKDAVQKAGEKDGKVFLRWERDGKMMSAELVPTSTASRDPVLNKTTQFTVGVVPMLSWAEPVTVIERVLNPFTLLYKGTERMITFSWRNFVSLQKMLVGDVSVATLGGPILIGKIAGESLSHGLIAFLTTMAILSIGLGVLNILPIPVLDGGHLLLLAIESLRGKPLTIRQMEVIQGVGLSLILVLMAIVIRNDIIRLPIFN